MIIFLVFLCFIMICSCKFCFPNLDSKYLSKEYTQAIKGIFVIIQVMAYMNLLSIGGKNTLIYCLKIV